MALNTTFDRTARRAIAHSFVMAIGLLGCGDAADGATVPSDDTLDEPTEVQAQQEGARSGATWCDVKPILTKSCTGCHDGEGTGGSPMGLTKPADFTANAPVTKGKKVSETVSARIHDTTNPMPPRGLLPAADLAKLDAWIAAGSPAGPTPRARAAAPSSPSRLAAGRLRRRVRAACEEHGRRPLERGAGGESHRRFYHDAPWGNRRCR